MKYVVLMTVFLMMFGCTYIEKRPPNSANNIGVVMKNYSLEEFTETQAEMTYTELEITTDGKELISQEGNKKCVYYQLLDHTQFSDGGESWQIANITKEKFYLRIDANTQIEIKPTSELRLFISPYVITDVKKEGARTQTRLYCLEKGKKYYIRIEPKSLAYGAPLPDGTRMTNSRIFVKISDTPFKDKTPQVEESPAFKDYIYG